MTRKLCKDCEYLVENPQQTVGGEPSCRHPELIDYVTGDQIIAKCYDQRATSNVGRADYCGREGRFWRQRIIRSGNFERKPKPSTKTPSDC